MAAEDRDEERAGPAGNTKQFAVHAKIIGTRQCRRGRGGESLDACREDPLLLI